MTTNAWDKTLTTFLWTVATGFCALCITGFFFLNSAVADLARDNSKDHTYLRREFVEELKSVRIERREDMQILKADILKAIERIR